LSDRRRRDSTEIKYEILMSSISGNKKTHIMYGTGLNLRQLNLYLEELMSHGTLEFKPLERKYFITNKGRAFVTAFDHYRETVNALDKQETALAEFFATEMGRPLVTPRDRPRDTKSHAFEF